eukprot:4316766-Amphidinium_carterae.1
MILCLSNQRLARLGDSGALLIFELTITEVQLLQAVHPPEGAFANQEVSKVLWHLAAAEML